LGLHQGKFRLAFFIYSIGLMIRIATVVVLMLLAFPSMVIGQPSCTQSVRLTVVETHDFSPVHPAVVFVEELKRAFETDEFGVVLLDSICDGRYTLHVHGSGYADKEEVVNITGKSAIRIKVDYEEHSLSEVVVADEYVRTVLQTRDQLDKHQLNAASGKSLADMMQGLTGVTMLSNGATISKPVIHGMHSNRIVMLNNGIRQEDQQWGSEHAPNIDPFLANSVTVIKGAASVRYGTDAIGGVVLVQPAAISSKPGTAAEVNLAGFSNNRMGVASVMAEHTFKRIPALGFRLQGTFKEGGTYRIPGHWVANTGMNERNFSATAAYRTLHYGAEVFYSRFDTRIGIYRGAHTGNESDLRNAINSPVPLVESDFTYDINRPKQEVKHDLLKAKVYADNRLGMWSLVYGYQKNFRQEYDVVRIENGRAQLNLTLQTHTLNLDLEHKPIRGVKGNVGFDGIFQDNSFQDGDRLFIPTYQSVGGAVYAIERYTKNKWTAELGLRYDYRFYGVYNPEGSNQQNVYYSYDFSNLSGTLGLRYQMRDNWQWSLTAANAWRAPQANELFSAGLHHGAARIELGNRDLNAERSYSLNLESKYQYGEKFFADVALYSQVINDYIYLEPGENLLTIRGYFKTFNYRQTNAWLNGADVTLAYHWNEHFQTGLKGSTLFARDRSRNDWLILMPADRVSLSGRYSKDFGKRLLENFIEVNARYVFEQKRIPSNFDEIDYPRPPGAYFLLDVAIGTKMLFGKQPVYLSLSATNLLNQRYRDYLDVFRYFIDQPGRNIALRVRVPFDFKNNN